MAAARNFTKTIYDYYKLQKIKVRGYLQEDINLRNNKSLVYIDYCINNLQDISGIKQLLEDLASMDASGNNAYRIYHNSIVEMDGIFHVHAVFKQKIKEVESSSNKILSPRRVGEKSCDIKAEENGREIYYESKDASVEITSRWTKGEFQHWTPMSAYQIEKWVLRKISDADQKGADYLLCKVPMWKRMTERVDINTWDDWAKKTFKNLTQIGPAHFKINNPELSAIKLKGFYILKSKGAIKFDI